MTLETRNQDRPKRNEWLAVSILAMSALALGVFGFLEHAKAHGQKRDWIDAAYLAAQLFSMNSGAQEPPISWSLQVARWLAPAVLVLAAIKGLVLLARRSVGDVQAARLRGHLVVVGISDEALAYVKWATELRSPYKRPRVVLIADREGDWRIDKAISLKARIVIGSGTDPSVLRRAGTTHAATFVSAMDSDASNLACLQAAREIAARDHRDIAEGPLRCYVFSRDPKLYDLLEDVDRFGDDTDSSVARLVGLHDYAARSVVCAFPPHIRWSNSPPVPAGVHVLIVGLGALGDALARHVARTCLYSEDRALRLTLVTLPEDPNPFLLMHRLASVSRFVDSEVVSQAQLSEALVRRGEPDIAYFAAASLPAGLPHAIWCRDDVRIPMETQLIVLGAMPQVGGSKQDSDELDTASAFARDHLEKRNIRLVGPKLPQLGSKAAAYDPDFLASRVHEHYQGKYGAGEWRDASAYEKNSSRWQTDHIPVKLASLGLEIQDATDTSAKFSFSAIQLDQLQRLEHIRWMVALLLAGWRFDPEPLNSETRRRKKVHHLLCPFSELNETERGKDRDVIEFLPDLLASAEKVIVRKSPSAV